MYYSPIKRISDTFPLRKLKTEFSKVTVNKRVDRVKKRKGRNKVRKPQEAGTTTSLGTNNREAPFPTPAFKGEEENRPSLQDRE